MTTGPHWWHRRRDDDLSAYSTEPDPESHRRIALALSLLNHRPASARTAQLALRALQGATLDRLVLMDRESAA
jgi:hypothetical protein